MNKEILCYHLNVEKVDRSFYQKMEENAVYVIGCLFHHTCMKIFILNNDIQFVLIVYKK